MKCLVRAWLEGSASTVLRANDLNLTKPARYGKQKIPGMEFFREMLGMHYETRFRRLLVKAKTAPLRGSSIKR